MTKPKPVYTCPECRVISPGVHWIEPDDPREQPRPTPCPTKLATLQLEQARELTEAENEKVKEAARRIVADAAETMPQFSANALHDAFEAAQIPESAHGPAFNWARNQGLIEKTSERVMSQKQSTRRDLPVWRSLVYGQRRTA